MLKKIIYIGEDNGNAIYFDTKNQIPLKSPKSKMLDTEKSKNNSKYIVWILLGLLLIGSLGSTLIPKQSIFSGKYTIGTFILLISLWLMEFLFFTVLVYKALYKNQNKAIPATSKEFSYAIHNNNIWNIFSNKKVTFGKKLGMLLFILILVSLTIAIIPIGFAINTQNQLIGKKIGSEFIGISFLGIMPFVCILFLWINNPFRWLNVAEKYQKRKIKFENGEKNE